MSAMRALPYYRLLFGHSINTDVEKTAPYNSQAENKKVENNQVKISRLEKKKLAREKYKTEQTKA
jgi:hypothetical protein